MKKLFTTGEFAKLHNINKRTLHYYDEVGLFSPKEVGENGYRYYTSLQSIDFDLIHTMRKLGMSISEIKTYFECPNTENYELLLKEQIIKINETIRKANLVKKHLTDKLNELAFSKSIKDGEIQMIELDEVNVLLSENISGRYYEQDYNVYQDFSTRLKNAGSRMGNFGSIISMDSIMSGNYNNYERLFLRSPSTIEDVPSLTRPKGKYLRAYVIGSLDKIPKMYDRILTYGREHNLSFDGYAYEEGINDVSSENMDEYVTEITIKIIE